MNRFQVADYWFDVLPAFERLLFSIVHRFGFAPVLDVDAQVVLAHAPVAKVDVDGFGLYSEGLHQDAGLLDLLVQCVAVVRVAGEGPGSHGQGSFERGGNAHFHAELVGSATPAFGDAFVFLCVLTVQLGLLVFEIVVSRLGDQTRRFRDSIRQNLF